jgi:hypothetical protein
VSMYDDQMALSGRRGEQWGPTMRESHCPCNTCPASPCRRRLVTSRTADSTGTDENNVTQTRTHTRTRFANGSEHIRAKDPHLVSEQDGRDGLFIRQHDLLVEILLPLHDRSEDSTSVTVEQSRQSAKHSHSVCPPSSQRSQTMNTSGNPGKRRNKP